MHGLRSAVTASLLLGLPVGSLAEAQRPPTIGSRVPGFEATSLDGTRVSLDESMRASRPVVVLFLSTVCPYANYFAGRIDRLAETYAGRVQVVGVNSNAYESLAEVKEHLQERGFDFPMVKDDDQAIADRLGATRTPEAYLIDAEGRLRYHGWVLSKQESPDLERAIEAVLAGRAVRRPVTKAFGCAIDRP